MTLPFEHPIVQRTCTTNYLLRLPQHLAARQQNSPSSERGGYYSSPDPSLTVDTQLVQPSYSYYHHVFQLSHDQLPSLRSHSGIGSFDSIAKTLAEDVSYYLKSLCLPFDFSELCIRTIWYPGGEELMYSKHLDSCFLTVPLLDSSLQDYVPMPDLFYGALAQDYGYKPTPHYLKQTLVPRVYVAAFVQLSFDTVMPTGKVYGDELAKLVQKKYLPVWQQF